MKRLILIYAYVVFLFACASVPQSTDVLVRYPVEGKIVWMSEDGSLNRQPYFIIDHEAFIEFLNREREIEREMGE